MCRQSFLVVATLKTQQSWTVELFIGCKHSMAARKMHRSFTEQQPKEIVQDTRVRAKDSAVLGVLLRNYRENRVEHSSLLFHCICALPESNILPSFFFSLPCLYFKSVVVSMSCRGTCYEGQPWAPSDIRHCLAEEEENRPTSATPVSVQCA